MLNLKKLSSLIYWLLAQLAPAYLLQKLLAQLIPILAMCVQQIAFALSTKQMLMCQQTTQSFLT